MKITAKHFIFAICNGANGRGDHIEGPIIWINTRKHWQNGRCIADHYHDAEREFLDVVAELLDIFNDGGAVWGCVAGSDVTVDSMTAKLAELGFEHCGDFQAFFDRIHADWKQKHQDGAPGSGEVVVGTNGNPVQKSAEPAAGLYRCAACKTLVTGECIVSIGSLASARDFGVEIGDEVCDSCYGD